MSKIVTDVKYSLVQFCRSRQSIFFAFILPVLFLVLAWYLFGWQSGALTLYYTDMDRSPTSHALIASMDDGRTLNLVDGQGQNLSQWLKEGKIAAYMEIPLGFGARAEGAVAPGNVSGSGIEVFCDRSKPYAASTMSVVLQAVAQFNMNRTGTGALASLDARAVSATGARYADFLLPGVLGIAIFGTALDLAVGFIVTCRATGILRKLATTPFERIGWIASRMIAGTIVVLISVTVTLAVAYVFFGARPCVSFTAVMLVIAGAVMSTGLGIVLAYLVRDVQSASYASFTITLPLILISGSLFPVERLPWFLRAVSTFSPLTFLNDGLRSAITVGDTADAMVSLAIVGALGVILFCVGVVTLRLDRE